MRAPPLLDEPRVRDALPRPHRRREARGPPERRDRLTGRVGGVARTIALCTAAFGPLSAGLLLDSFSVRATVAVYAALMLLLCVLASFNSAIRNAPSLSDLDVLPTRSASHAEGG